MRIELKLMAQQWRKSGSALLRVPPVKSSRARVCGLELPRRCVRVSGFSREHQCAMPAGLPWRHYPLVEFHGSSPSCGGRGALDRHAEESFFNKGESKWALASAAEMKSSA